MFLTDSTQSDRLLHGSPETSRFRYPLVPHSGVYGVRWSTSFLLLTLPHRSHPLLLGPLFPLGLDSFLQGLRPDTLCRPYRRPTTISKGVVGCDTERPTSPARPEWRLPSRPTSAGLTHRNLTSAGTPTSRVVPSTSTRAAVTPETPTGGGGDERTSGDGIWGSWTSL